MTSMRSRLPELPAARRARFALAYGCRPTTPSCSPGAGMADYFEEDDGAPTASPKIVANWDPN